MRSKNPPTLSPRPAGLVALIFGIVCLVGSGLARAGRLEGMFPWQIVKLRWLLAASAVWLIVVGLVALRSAQLERGARPGWQRRSSRSVAGLQWASTVLVGLIICQVGAYGWLSIARHARFNSTGYDLAIKEQVIWNTAHGRLFRSSFEVTNYFADHFQPVLAILAPLHLLFPTPVLLLVIQTITIAIGAMPLYRIGQRRLGNDTISLLVAAAYLLYPSIGFINRFDFHPEALAIPAFLFAFDALERGDARAASLWLLAPLLSKENMGLSVAAFGVYAAIRLRRARFGWSWAVVGVTVSLATTLWLIPTLRLAPSDTLSRYAWLGDAPHDMLRTLLTDPMTVARRLAEPNRALYIVQLLVPTGFLAVLGLPELLMSAPGLIINLLADHYYQPTIYCQYTTPIVPFVFIATATGLGRLRHALDALGNSVRLRAIAGGMLPLVLIAIAIDNPFTERNQLPDPLSRLPNESCVQQALPQVPEGSSVVTTNAYAPHLARREELEVLGIPSSHEPSTSPDVVFINLYDQRYALCDDYYEYLMRLDISHYGIIFRDCGVVIIQRNGGSNDALREFLSEWNNCAG
ncbi:MAG: DUF2079 domain-containing protein [Chloroflexi bacterium]|nr:DUF2079 domain-containing protein [Chloroflexota bacterium]